jgi:hypothetical protein
MQFFFQNDSFSQGCLRHFYLWTFILAVERIYESCATWWHFRFVAGPSFIVLLIESLAPLIVWSHQCRCVVWRATTLLLAWWLQNHTFPEVQPKVPWFRGSSGCFLSPQKCLKFGQEFSPGDQHPDFIVFWVTCGGGRKGKKPRRRSPTTTQAVLGASMAKPEPDTHINIVHCHPNVLIWSDTVARAINPSYLVGTGRRVMV